MGRETCTFVYPSPWLGPVTDPAPLCETCDEPGTPARPLVVSRDVAGRATLRAHRECAVYSSLREPAWRKLNPKGRPR